MAKTTFFVKEATAEPGIGQIEALLSQYDGMERILIDPDDGEIKIQFDESKITPEQIATALMEEDYMIH